KIFRILFTSVHPNSAASPRPHASEELARPSRMREVLRSSRRTGWINRGVGKVVEPADVHRQSNLATDVHVGHSGPRSSPFTPGQTNGLWPAHPRDRPSPRQPAA